MQADNTKKQHTTMSHVLSRGVEEVIDAKNLAEKIQSGKKLRVKLGIDPTSPNIHLGRSIPLLKLKDFQELGHTVVFIIGDFTGVIGDTSDKESERPMLSDDVVQKNLDTYIQQAGKIIDVNKAEIHRNSEWLTKLGYAEIGRHADAFSLNAFISRENIAKRLDQGKRVSLRELLYPLMQGYDSVHVRADVEVGGTDQRFNLLAGRDLQRLYGQVPQDVITNPLIAGMDGKKMSSSVGNTINVFDTPNDMFGKVMSIRDELTVLYFTMLTRVDMVTVAEYAKELEHGANPRDIKMKLAYELVRMYHSDVLAQEAQEYFVQTFSKKEIPSVVPSFTPHAHDILSVLVESGLVTSKSEARRVLLQKGVRVDGEVVEDEARVVSSGVVVQKGKMAFLRIT